MGEIVNKIINQVTNKLNQQYGSDRSCPICPKPVAGFAYSIAPNQSVIGAYCLPALTEAVPGGFRLAHERFLVVVAVRCERCGNVRLFDGTAEAESVVEQQGESG